MAYEDTLLAMTPTAYWRFDEPSGVGATVAVDQMALRNGTYINAPTLGVAGLITEGTAVTFDGINDRITVPAMPAMAAWSVAYWWKPTASTTGLASIVEFNSFDMILAQMPGDFAGFWDGVGVVTATVPATVGEAAFWVWTFSAATLRIYKNGQLVYTAVRGRAVGADTLTIGMTSDGSNFITGTLDEVAIWNRAVTAAEVAALYQAGITSTAISLATLAQVKARINPAGVSDTVDDTLISELIVQVSAWIENFTGRWFTPRSGTYVLDTDGGYVLRVSKGIRSVSSFGFNALANQPETGGTYSTLASTAVMLRPSSLDLPPGWPATEVWLSRATNYVFGTVQNGATITGEFGFAAVPPDIQAVCIDATVAAYQSRKNGASGVIGAEGEAIIPWVSFFSSGSPQRATLERYRYPALG